MKISLGSSCSPRSSRSCSSYALPSAIAFWKIVGLEVTPVTASSSIIRASPPWCTRLRERLSIQTLCPSADSWCSRELPMVGPFESLDFPQTEHVPLASPELGGQERANQVGGQLGADDLRPEAEHVHVVVLDALVCGVHVVADRGADTRQLARGDRCADAGAADEHATLGGAAEDRLSDLACLIGVVDAHGVCIRAKVDDVVAELGELFENTLAKLDAAMIERDRHLHMRVTLPGWTTCSSGVSSDSSSESTRFGAQRLRSPATQRRGCPPPT